MLSLPPAQMVRVCGNSFEKHHHSIVECAVGGGIACSLGEQSLRSLLADTSITFKPQQDVIIRALDELRRNTEASVAALEKSGSPYTFAVVRALRTHNAAYITFTKVAQMSRGRWGAWGVEMLEVLEVLECGL